MATRFAHSNLIASNWHELARFYERVLDCRIVGPERDLSGPAIDALTGIPGARIRGAHVRVPGHGADGPSLEIFCYDQQPAPALRAINSPGIAHLAFEVDDVAETLGNVLEHGGDCVGEVTSINIPGAGVVTLVYARDPEGNILELQSWSHSNDDELGGASRTPGN